MKRNPHRTMIISQQRIFLLEQEEIILPAKSRLFSSWSKRIPFASSGSFSACSRLPTTYPLPPFLFLSHASARELYGPACTVVVTFIGVYSSTRINWHVDSGAPRRAFSVPSTSRGQSRQVLKLAELLRR